MPRQKKMIDFDTVAALLVEFKVFPTVEAVLENVTHRGVIWMNGCVVAATVDGKWNRWAETFERKDVMSFIGYAKLKKEEAEELARIDACFAIAGPWAQGE